MAGLEPTWRLKAALVVLSGGDMDFKIVNGFVMALETDKLSPYHHTQIT